MSATIGARTLVSFAAGAVVAVISLAVFQAITADAAPGDVDSTFVPITACRLFDTRPAPDRVGPFGAFGPGDTKTIKAHGSNGECVIPADAVGLSLNVTAIEATAPTFLTIWPNGQRPLASSLNPTPGQPPTPNAVATNLSGEGSFELYNLAGTVHVLADVNGYYTKSTLRELEERVAELESLTASMSVADEHGNPTVKFSGVNVRIESGSGSTTGATNGRGNLIVGYNEDSTGEVRGGSHNIVLGAEHDYNGYGALITGHNNEVEDRAIHAAVLGGSNGYITGPYSASVGGQSNSVTGPYSAAVGGSGNSTLTNSDYAAVVGGEGNAATGVHSSVTGGRFNTADGLHSSVSGGRSNSSPGEYSSVSGGYMNVTASGHSSILGGRENRVDGEHSAVAGGVSNTADGVDDVIVGGDDLTCPYADAVICGEYTTFTAGWDARD